MMNNSGWGMGWGMWFIPIIIILAIYFLVKKYLQTKSGPNSESPIEILKRRYANGEITKEQFEEIKKNIS
ncbi:SHOCT domain-containing protein [Flavobacterium sp. LS1P3]|uniref:SHOCT domain-containing protein n=1 Tax=Flavobacterium sp. LS1P3 TaxID=3401720 RepID=UPI003AADF6B8